LAVTPQQITEALTAANIPNPECRLDYTNERYRVTAHTNINGQTYSHGAIVDTEATEDALTDVVERFRLWHSELNDAHGHE
jgi:hypothetical protein